MTRQAVPVWSYNERAARTAFIEMDDRRPSVANAARRRFHASFRLLAVPGFGDGG